MVADSPGWRVDAGAYELRVGRSAEDIVHVAAVRIRASGCPSP
jgi:hypothetical protein